MKKNIVLIAFLVISIIVSGIVLTDRIQVESENKYVDIILDYREIDELAKQSSYDISWWLQRFKELGIEYVAINEETIELLEQQNYPIEYMLGKDAIKNAKLDHPNFNILKKHLEDNEVGEYDLVVLTRSQDMYDFIKGGLEGRYTEDKFDFVIGEGSYFVILKGGISEALYIENIHLKDELGKAYAAGTNFESSKLIRVGLGFSQDKIDKVEESGLKVLARPFSFYGWVGEKYLEAVIKDLTDNNMVPSMLIFGGSEVLGYSHNLDVMKDFMVENNIKLGLIETPVQRGHIEQRGLDLLTRSLNYEAVRVFSILPWMQERFQFANYSGAEEIENMMYRSVTERNIRTIYFRPFKKNKVEYVTDFNEYEKMFNRFEERIGTHGIELGMTQAMRPIRVRLIKQTLMAWGIVAAGVFLLSYLFKLKNRVKYSLFILGILGTPLAFVIRPYLMEKVMALGAAIIFPSLGMLYFCHACYNYYVSDKEMNLGKKIVTAIKDLIIVSAISGIGAIFVASILSNIEFLLELDIFRGVKFSQLIPFLIYGLIYFAYFGYNSKDIKNEPSKVKINDIKALLFDNIKVFHAIIGGILLIVGYIYIARTGHETNIQPSEFELVLRNILEENLLARPRTKEFLIAFPILMTGIFFAIEKYKALIFMTGLLAVIGQTSIVNTFSHLRTPVYLSVIRTVYSLGIGIVFGVIYILAFILLLKIVDKIKKINLYE